MKKILLLSFLVIFINSCSKDHYDEANSNSNNSNKFIYKKVKKETLIKNSTLQKKLNELTNLQKNLKESRLVYDSIYDFSIDTRQANYLQNGDYESFTFPIIRANSDLAENLLISKNANNTYDAFIIKFKFDNTQYQGLSSAEILRSIDKIVPINFDYTLLLGAKCDYNLVCFENVVWDVIPTNQGDNVGGADLYEMGWVVESTFCEALWSCGSNGGDGDGSNPNYSPPSEGYGGGGGSGISYVPYVLTPEEQRYKNLYFNQLSPEHSDWLANNPTVNDNVINYLEDIVNGGSGLSSNLTIYPTDAVQFVQELIETSIELDIDAISIWMNDYDNFRAQMSITERNIFDNLLQNRKMWYMVSAYKAFNKASELYPESVHNGKGDAYRHSLWNALCSLFLGTSLTEQLTSAHEDRPPSYTYSYMENAMDLYNNHQGRIVATYSNFTNVYNNILEHLNLGLLKYLNNLDDNGLATSTSTLTPTNQ